MSTIGRADANLDRAKLHIIAAGRAGRQLMQPVTDTHCHIHLNTRRGVPD